MAEGARADLQEHLGPEFSQFDLNDMNPKHFVRKHLLDESGDPIGRSSRTAPTAATGRAERRARRWAGRSAQTVTADAGRDAPPYDAEAT